MKNGLRYQKGLFWQAMEDISTQARLISGYSWTELKDMIEEQVQESQPQIYSVKSVTVPTIPPVVFSRVVPTDHFYPSKVRHAVMILFDQLQLTPTPNRGCLSGSAKSLTFGAQTEDLTTVESSTGPLTESTLVALTQCASWPRIPKDLRCHT